MLFLSASVYLVLWTIASWLFPQMPLTSGLPWGLRVAIVSGLAFLVALFVVFLIETYSPLSTRWWRGLTRLRGVRWFAGLTAAVLVGLTVIQVYYLHDVPGLFVLGLIVPIVTVSLLNFVGIDIPVYRRAEEAAVTPTDIVPQGPEPAESNGVGDVIRRDHSWRFEGQDLTVSIEIRRNLYEQYRARVRDLDYMRWSRVYVTEGLCSEVRELALYLHRLGVPYGTYREVALVLSFVQSVLTYQREDGEYPRYPVESVVDGVGDCEDYAILGAALLKDMGYEVALLFVPGHAALGVGGADDLPGTYAEVDGRHYYYCEMISEGWLIGEIPDEYSASDIQISRVPDPEAKVVVPEGG